MAVAVLGGLAAAAVLVLVGAGGGRGGGDGCAQAAGEVPSKDSTKEHNSFGEVRKWIKSAEVKADRKKKREKAKAKQAIASKDAVIIPVTGGSGPRSDAADKENETANGSDSDEGDKEWAPSYVSSTNRDYITVTRMFGSDKYRVNKGRMSGVILHHVYDNMTDDSQLVQIQSVEKIEENIWKIKFCRVYSTEQAILAAEQDDDKVVIIKRTGQADKILVVRGRNHLRGVLKTSNERLYHVGDVPFTWRADFIVGVAAMLPASALLSDKKELNNTKVELKKALTSHCGMSFEEATRLAADPIIWANILMRQGQLLMRILMKYQILILIQTIKSRLVVPSWYSGPLGGRCESFWRSARKVNQLISLRTLMMTHHFWGPFLPARRRTVIQNWISR